MSDQSRYKLNDITPIGGQEPTKEFVDMHKVIEKMVVDGRTTPYKPVETFNESVERQAIGKAAYESMLKNIGVPDRGSEG